MMATVADPVATRMNAETNHPYSNGDNGPFRPDVRWTLATPLSRSTRANPPPPPMTRMVIPTAAIEDSVTSVPPLDDIRTTIQRPGGTAPPRSARWWDYRMNVAVSPKVMPLG